MKQILSFCFLLLIAVIKVHSFSFLSPYSYCAANPVNYIDPSGCKVEGVKKEDAAMVVQDLKQMFPGEKFEKFRALITQSGKKQDGKTLSPIKSENLTSALEGVELSEDQQTLVNIVVNTINSKDTHKVEYVEGTGVLSHDAAESFLPPFTDGDLGPYVPLILEKNGGFPISFITNEGGGGVTTPTKNGSHSLIILSGEHPNGRAVTTGHEIFGHGRSHACGIGNKSQHVEAIRTENLILRVMGIPFINTGINHGRDKTPVINPSFLPSFR